MENGMWWTELQDGGVAVIFSSEQSSVTKDVLAKVSTAKIPFTHDENIMLMLLESVLNEEWEQGGDEMKPSVMVFKIPKPANKPTSPIIRLRPEVVSRVYEIVEHTGLTPS